MSEKNEKTECHTKRHTECHAKRHTECHAKRHVCKVNFENGEICQNAENYASGEICENADNHVLTALKESANSVCLCTFDAKTAFYLRFDYLELVEPLHFEVDSVFSSEQFDDCVQAGLCYAVERQAFVYLNACEHSRFLLKNKLAKKNFENTHIEKVLDYLESKNFLSDKRYAEAFIKNRAITHNEGKTRILKELLVRGVSNNDAKIALENYYELYSEEEFCKKAVEKLRRLGKGGDKLVNALQRAGFSLKMINTCINEL